MSLDIIVERRPMKHEVAFTPANVITERGRIALTVLSTHLRADMEILKNEETGDEFASLVRFGKDPLDDFEVHFMPDPYSRHGYGWVAVSNEKAVVASTSLVDTVKRYRLWRTKQA